MDTKIAAYSLYVICSVLVVTGLCLEVDRLKGKLEPIEALRARNAELERNQFTIVLSGLEVNQGQIKIQEVDDAVVSVTQTKFEGRPANGEAALDISKSTFGSVFGCQFNNVQNAGVSYELVDLGSPEFDVSNWALYGQEDPPINVKTLTVKDSWFDGSATTYEMPSLFDRATIEESYLEKADDYEGSSKTPFEKSDVWPEKGGA